MQRPDVICHMVTSLDGKVTGDFLSHPACAAAVEVYYACNRAYRAAGAGGFICGRVTMEQSFTGGYYPDLTGYDASPVQGDFWPQDVMESDFFAIAFDPKGRLGWREATITDSDPGYDRARIIEVVSEQTDARYLAYLRRIGIPYLIAGKAQIDVAQVLQRLGERLPYRRYLLEGGSIINGHFLRAGCVDALSLVQAPVCADAADQPLFGDARFCGFSLRSAEQREGALVLQYEKEACQ